MSANWAEDNLQTIRTLMERASVYRRALAPVSMAAGGMGLSRSSGRGHRLDNRKSFAFYWLAVAFLTGRRVGVDSTPGGQAGRNLVAACPSSGAGSAANVYGGLGLGVLEV